VTRRPVLLDLFCGAGGAAVGYWRAGFDVLGVDHRPQPRYPFPMVIADALTWPLGRVDAIHASPPCRDHTQAAARNRAALGERGDTAWMLNATVERLAGDPRPWVVENVGNAAMPSTVAVVQLCGSAFDLDVRRHRLFASNTALLVPTCAHERQTPRFRTADTRAGTASVVSVYGHTNYRGDAALRRAAMGIEWMTVAELSQAIPPAYTEHLGRQLIAAVGADAHQT
jgi:DNA (cytosine-5)-methyltransferase 1